jgi:hypothetical protein
VLSLLKYHSHLTFNVIQNLRNRAGNNFINNKFSIAKRGNPEKKREKTITRQQQQATRHENEKRTE